jgi:hypothetical protein
MTVFLTVVALLTLLILRIGRRILGRASSSVSARTYIAITVVGLLCVALLLSITSSLLAGGVKSGLSTEAARFGPLIVYPLNAYPARLAPAGKSDEAQAINELAGKRLLYLGQSNGSLVLYNSTDGGAIYIPTGSAIMQIENCNAQRSTLELFLGLFRPVPC